MIVRAGGWQIGWKLGIKGGRKDTNLIKDLRRKLHMEKLLSQRWLGEMRKAVRLNILSEKNEGNNVGKMLNQMDDGRAEGSQQMPRGGALENGDYLARRVRRRRRMRRVATSVSD